MSNLIEIRDLKVSRDKRRVLEIGSLNVEKGEVLAVVGPNGTGKSSLLLTLAHLLRPESGALLWDGTSLDEQDSLSYRRRIALVLQEPLLLDLPVFDNVALGLRFRNVPGTVINAKVNHWLQRVGMAALRDRPGSQLSGGEAQRVSLARAFVLDPELLLLDEPFSALDAPTRLRLLDDLKSILAETGTTTIVITHDLQEAARLASRVAVMLDGCIAQIGSPNEVFANPASGEVAGFLGL
ncbi:MAG TPA: ABC transporter ATP-binding protein [Anaerolineales bacterium]|jgi:tungstate transport system ATP-binding protein